MTPLELPKLYHVFNVINSNGRRLRMTTVGVSYKRAQELAATVKPNNFSTIVIEVIK